MLSSIKQDIVYTVRALRKNPIFAATALFTLALGIGGNTAMFTIVRTVLLKPLEYPHPDELMEISGGASPARFEELKANAKSFSGIAASTGLETLTLLHGSEPAAVTGARISAGYLEILGLKPIIGHGFRLADDLPGAAPTAMLSTEIWRRNFQGDAAIAGKTVTLSTTVYTIIGVLPPGMQFPSPDVDIWLTRPLDWPLMPAKSRVLSPFLTLIGRLRPNVDITQANAELLILHRRYAAAHPAMLDAKAKSPVELQPLKEKLVTNVRPMLWLLFGAVGFVLLIACANVAGILLAHATSRAREFALRAAIGASRARLARQLLVESILLSSVGGALGVALAFGLVRAASRMTSFQMPRAGEIQFDWLVLAFAAALSIGAGLLFGFLPSLAASRIDLIQVLKGSGGAMVNARAGRWPGFDSRGLLITGQVALSMILLIGAALLLQSLAHLRGADVGFNPSHLLTCRISLPEVRYGTDQKRALFFQQLVDDIQTAPGVRSAAAAMFLPMTGFVGSPVQDAAKPPLKLNERTIATLQMVTPHYFSALDIPLKSGKDFSDRDKAASERVAIIDEVTARYFWPAYRDSGSAGFNPLGQHLLIGGLDPRPALIVGIVATAHQNLVNNAWPETVYIPFAQSAQPSAMLAVRTEGESSAAVSIIRAKLRGLDREQPLSDVKTMDELLDAEVGQRRVVVILLGSFAGFALLLAMVGLYGVVSYSVAKRAPELGVRWAIGAQRSDLLWLVIRQGLGFTLIGIILGTVGALALGKLFTSLLFEVQPNDPLTLLGTALLFACAALWATYIPAHRATRGDPMAALRL